MRQYEAMFLFDPTFGASWESCEAEIRRLLDRAGAELLFSKKWEERRLAYKIKGRKRGVYVLTYFNASPNRIVGLERDIRISECVLRALVVRAEGVTKEMMEQAVSLHGAMATSDEGGEPESEYERGGERDREGRPRRRRTERGAAVATAETEPASAVAEATGSGGGAGASSADD